VGGGIMRRGVGALVGGLGRIGGLVGVGAWGGGGTGGTEGADAFGGREGLVHSLRRLGISYLIYRRMGIYLSIK
jgi:hypothetical protein